MKLVVAAWIAALIPGIGGAALAAALGAATGAVPDPSAAGLLDIALVGMLVGVVSGFPFLLFRARIPACGAWVGFLWGLVILAAVFAFLPPATRSAVGDLAWTNAALTLGLSALVFGAWGLALERSWSRIADRPPERRLELYSDET